jgi:basic amino acid/polyamine antiporter, APA family
MTAPALKRTLRPVHLAAIGMGTTIGVGWIVVTGGWIADAGPGGAALAFAIGGLVMGLVGLCYADMAARLPTASGEYGYVSHVFGRGWGFVVGWMVLLGYIGICCFEGLALAWLISVLAPEWTGPTLYVSLGAPVRVLDLAVVIGGAVFFTAVNYLGARESARVQVAVTAGKVVLSFAFIAVGLAGGDLANWTPALHPVEAPWRGVAAVLVIVPAWFCGFNALPQALDEAHERPSMGALALMLGGVIALTSLFYITVIAATAAAAPRETLIGSELPVVAAIEAVAGPWGGRVVLITGVIALLSAWNAALFAASRLIHTLGRDGALPPFLSRVHPRYGTPSAAIVFVGVVALAGGLMGRAFIEPLIQMGAIGFAGAFIATSLSSAALMPTTEAPRRGVSPAAGLIGAAALAGVVVLSLVDIFAGGWSAEATALAGWAGAGLVFWVAGAVVRRAPAPTPT